MKRIFDKPLCSVVRFSQHDLVTSSQCPTDCWCDSCGVDDFGYGKDECVGRNLPQCTCATVTEANCV